MFVREELNKVLTEAGKYAQKDNETKKEFILRVKEKVQTLFRLETKPKSELASYIYNLLTDINFSVARPWFESCFTDEEKRNYSTKFSTEHFIEEKPGIERNPVTGQLRIDGVTYSPDLPTEAKPHSLERPEKPSISQDEYIESLRVLQGAFMKYDACIDVICERYDENKDLVQSVLKPLKEKQDQYTRIYANAANSKEVLDDRNKWGDYEKAMAKAAIEHGGETIAHIAKLMGYSSKFGSIGILNNEILAEKIRSLGLCPKCKGDIWFEKNEELKQVEIKARLEI